MRIQHNIMAMNAYRNYSNNTSALSKNLEKLSSGYKINRAGDDAAGLAISEKMRAQITGLEVAQKNAKDGISLVQTAEGALTEVHDMLNRMVELANQSANGTYEDSTDRNQLQKEINQLRDEINRIADSANFNGIKLLDGSLEDKQLSELPVDFNTVSSTSGVTIDPSRNGGGTKGEFTIDITKMFSEGDTIKLDMVDSNGGDQSATLKMNTGGTAATDFSGNTAEEQAKSIAAKLGIDANFGTNFDISVDGTKITLTAKEEGTDTPPMLKGTTVTGTSTVNVASQTTATQDGTDGTGGTAYKGVFELIGGSGATATNLEAGDKLTFTFKDAQGNDLTVDLLITDEMIDPSAQKTIEAVTKALENATFKDNADTTGVDESKIKVGDLFTLAANKNAAGTGDAYGSINVTANNAGAAAGGFTAVNVVLNRNGTKTTVAATADTGTNAAPGTTNAKKDKWTLAAGTATTGTNYTVGDKVKFEGTLADGSKFSMELVAGVDFKVGNNIDESMKNLGAALSSDKVTINITNKDGSTDTMTGADLFGANGEFTVDTTTKGSVVIEAKNNGTAGTYSASNLTGITVTPIDDAAVETGKTLATAQSSAQSSFTIGEGLEYGAAIQVGDTVYEIVADARDTTNRNNTAIVVSDLTDTAAIADALAKAIQGNVSDYTVSATGSTVTIESNKVGSDQVALEVTAPYGDEITTASFKFDPSAVEEGSVLTFNGNTYEFVKTGEKPTNSGAIAIEVDDFENMTAKSLGDAFANVAKNGVVSVAEDGTVTLKSLEGKDGTIAAPSISFGDSLTLQIGDTSESFNQLSVNIKDCHVASLGLDAIDISNQKGAQAAVDVIKEAINYVSDVRGTLGATQNRLDHTINNLSVMQENIQDAESTIRDTDVADEMMAYTKNNILIQSAQAMLAQANQVPQGVLQLLQ